MDPVVLFLKEDILPEEKSEVDKIQRRLLGSGCLRTKNYINAYSLGHTCYAYTSRQQNCSLRSYMRGFAAATLEVDLWRTEPSLKDTNGQTCKRKHRNM